MASGMASSHCGLAGTGRAFRLQLLLRSAGDGEELSGMLGALYRLVDGRTECKFWLPPRAGTPHKGRYGIPECSPAVSFRRDPPRIPCKAGGKDMKNQESSVLDTRPS